MGSLVGADARPFGSPTASTGAAAIAASSAQANAQQAAATASLAMKRAASAVQALRDVQAAARAAAMVAGTNVPNGLTPGGLVVAPGAAPGITDGGAGLWQGANLPTQVVSGGRTQVEIKQTQAKAILTWEKFNVGRETDLHFNQTAGGTNVSNWIALNRVTDPSASPSQILGTIKAEGQVYIINRNGIVFGGSSQVNVHTLVASSLSLSNAQFMAGINKTLFISNPVGTVAIPTFGDAPSSFEPTTDPISYGPTPGSIVIQPGAVIASQSGGKAILFAPHVSNAGIILTPNGQTILGAGENAWLADPVISNAGSTLRGLDVAVSSQMPFLMDYNAWTWSGAPDSTKAIYAAAVATMDARAASIGYSVSNSGAIEASRGNITIVGRDVAQNGVLVASTALNNQDGSILLRGWSQGFVGYGESFFMYSWAGGTLSLGSNSVTTVVPDLSDTSSIELSSLGTRYRAGSVDLRGTLIDIQAGATVVVPSGTITAVASAVPVKGSTPASTEPVADGSRLYIGEDALLSVAGLQDVLLSMESNTVQAELRINELRDSVLYRDSWLRGATVYVDKRVSGAFSDGPMAGVQWIRNADGSYQTGKWVGTPLGDVSSWIGTGSSNLGELSTVGGKINLKSSGDVIMRAGATLDVAGGSVRYADGYITTTKLLGADGRIYDIGAATPDRQYVGIANGGFSRYHARAKILETWLSPWGRGASTRFEQGYTEGRNAGGVVIYNAAGFAMEGELDGHVVTGQRQAAGGKTATAGSLQLGGGGVDEAQWLSSSIVVTSDPVRLGKDFGATSAIPTAFYDPSSDADYRAKTTYLDAGMLNRSGLGTINLYYNKTFKLTEDAHLELIPGAKFQLGQNINPSNLEQTLVTIDGSIRIAGGSIKLNTNNNMMVGAHAVLDVSGLWVNEYTSGAPKQAPLVNGGSIDLGVAESSAILGVVGTLEVASGAVLDVSGGGWLSNRGGKLKLQAGDAGTLTLTNLANHDLSGLDVRGYAAGSGGSLALSMLGDVQIGGAFSSDPAVRYVSGTLFADRGFRSLAIRTDGTITVPDGTSVSQVTVNVELNFDRAMASATGSKITDLGEVRVLDLQDRITRQPASLSIAADAVKIGVGATLATDVKGRIALGRNVSSRGSVEIDGTVDAPAGSVSVDTNSLTIAGTGSITATGVAVIVQDPATRQRSGTVLNGGSVSLSAIDVVIEPGARIDVSGTSGEIDVPAGGDRGAVNVASDGGLISIDMINGLIEGTFLGRPGGAGAAGGQIRINHRGSGGDAPRTTLQGQLAGLDPDCLGYFGNGVCTFGDWREALGFDFARMISDFGGSASGPMIFTEAMVTALPAAASGNLIISATGKGGGPTARPENFGWTATTLDEFLNVAFIDVRAPFDAVAGYKPAVVRPASLQGGGFASLSLTSGGKVVFDGVDLAFGRSIVIDGAITSAGAGTTRLTAPTIALLNAALVSSSTAPVATTMPAGPAGTGEMILTADLIDATKAVFSGFAETRLVTRDLRLGGLLPDLKEDRTAVLVADGRLELKAGQIYPATGVLASIKAGTQLVIAANGDSVLPLSAAGSLTLEAPLIEQNGVVRAPFGSIIFKASESVTLGAGSVTSVSGAGLVLPYGLLSNGEFWIDPTQPEKDGRALTLASLPEKKITLDAPSVNVAASSIIDIRGGGDLHASEFVVGSGGSHDILAMNGVYAILPSAPSAVAPNGTAAAGSRIWLAGGNGLAAGWYTLMPAQYALLPGAFAIQVLPGSAGKGLNSAFTLLDGATLMAGRLGNALDGSMDSLMSNVRVMNGAVVRSYSEYNEANANAFFSSEAFRLTQYRLTGIDIVTPRLPMDGGSVVFKATSQLVLDGQLQSAAAPGGRAGLVDIAATNIAVVGAGQDRSGLDGYLIIDSARLSSFGAASLLLGGVRSGTAIGLGVEVFAGSIVVRNDASSALVGPEIIMAASDTIGIDAGSVLKAEGEVTGGSGNLVMKPQVAANPANNGTPNDPSDDHPAILARDHGALIRLSNGDAVSVVRTNVDNALGTVDIGAGAVLSGGKALLIDATRSATLVNSAQVSAADITLSGSRIGFGGGTGLVFDAASLARFNAAENLTLRSYSTIDFFAGINFGSAGLKSVTFDATGLIGRSAGTTTITGDTVVLRNTVGHLADPSVTDQGALALNANRLVLGSGVKTLRGFSTVAFNAGVQVTGQGDGSLDAGTADLRLAAPIITGQNGASQSLTTSGVLTVLASGAAPAARDGDSLGSRWAFTAGRIDFGGRVMAIGGGVSLTARAGDLIMRDGAAIDVGGIGKAFNDVTAYVNAGNISLTAVGGSVLVNAGATLNLAAASGGGDAGILSAVASGGGTVRLDGSIDGHAAAGKGGSFTLDIAALPDFSGFSQRLEAAGFTRSRQFRVRTGDVVIDGDTRVENFVLSADAGKVTISGTIDASTAYGGSMTISAGNGLVMTSGASLTAHSITALGSGRVTLEAAGASLDIRGGIIDVSGGQGGKVRFRALQNSNHDGVAVSNLQVDIRGSRASVLEAVAVYTSADGTVETPWIGETPGTGAVVDANTFMAAAPGIRSTIAAGIEVMAGIEIRGEGDLTLNSTLDLATTFGSAHQGGLTLRAGKNLIINGNISDGFSDATRNGVLLAQDSWDLRLIAGADLGSANALAVTPIAGLANDSGSLKVGDAANGYLIRTGTGDLAVRAGRDVQLAHYQSVIYTAGKKDATVYADFTAPETAEYGILGGDLSIIAGGGISSTLPSVNEENMLYTNWLKKAGVVNDALLFTSEQSRSTWWVDYGRFTQGVGALGGGNVNVQAGGDLDNLLVALATTGRVHGGTVTAADKALQVDNGGAMTVIAGGAVKAGNYYIARGTATIDAGIFANGRTVLSINGSIATPYDIAPVLALGDATMNVRTAGDLRLQTVLDPLMSYDPALDFGQQIYMVGQTDSSRLSLISTGGNVSLVNQATYLSQDVAAGERWFETNRTTVQYVNQYAGNLYPAMTSVVALNGSISNLNQLSTLPAARGELLLLAARDIDAGYILMSRATPEMLASPFRPFGGPALQYNDLDHDDDIISGRQIIGPKFLALLQNAVDPTTYFGGNMSYFRSVANPDVLLNAGDTAPSRIYALKGSIRSGNVVSNEQTWISAGTDVLDLTLNLRNLHPTDVSWLHAGNDVLSHMPPSRNAVIDPTITIQGPGGLLLTAGRDVYADSIGIISTGNQTFIRSPGPAPAIPLKGLSAAGASIEVMAGLHGQQPDYAAMVSAYLDPAQAGRMPGYLTTTLNGQLIPLYLTSASEDRGGISKETRTGLVSFIKDMTGEVLQPLDAWAVFQTLPVLAQQRFLRQVYMQELRAAGRDHTDGGGTGGYQRGYDAIAALFPGDAWKGNVQIGNALMRTKFGGNIEIMTPGGGLQVAALNQTVGADYGLITLGYGSIDIFAKNDVVVNRSRVLTFSGGDVTIWSTLGSIDAGRGAKTTRVPSAPLIATDVDGVTRVKERADISGSGIGTIVGFAGVEPGDLDLIAPVGIVDAGDAGIRVSGNFNVAALIVLNTDNIKVAGESKGVPAVEAPAINLSAETKDKAASDAVKDATQQNGGSERPSVVIVEVLGFGGGDGERRKQDDEEMQRRSENRGQDPYSRIQVLGVGDLTSEQAQLLANGKRALVAR